MIGDVLMRHWQIEVLRLPRPHGQIDEKCRQAALGIPAHQDGVLAQPSKIFCRVRQQEIGDLAIARREIEHRAMLESQYTRVRRSFRTERMRSSAVKPKNFPRYVEVDDAALAILEGAAEPDHALDQKENILDRLAFQENDLVALMAYRAAPEGEKGLLGCIQISLAAVAAR